MDLNKAFFVAETILDIAMMHSDSLIARAREGDKNAQGKLMQMWYKRIYNFSYKFFFDHDLAMEVAQKTFISMHRNIEGLHEPSRFKSWLYTIAVNFCREELRKRKASRAVPSATTTPVDLSQYTLVNKAGDPAPVPAPPAYGGPPSGGQPVLSVNRRAGVDLSPQLAHTAGSPSLEPLAEYQAEGELSPLDVPAFLRRQG